MLGRYSNGYAHVLGVKLPDKTTEKIARRVGQWTLEDGGHQPEVYDIISSSVAREKHI